MEENKGPHAVAEIGGGQAFPIVVGDYFFFGLTVRDYFAAKAMQGTCANPDIDLTPEQAAFSAYSMADAMLAERAK